MQHWFMNVEPSFFGTLFERTLVERLTHHLVQRLEQLGSKVVLEPKVA